MIANITAYAELFLKWQREDQEKVARDAAGPGPSGPETPATGSLPPEGSEPSSRQARARARRRRGAV